MRRNRIIAFVWTVVSGLAAVVAVLGSAAPAMAANSCAINTVVSGNTLKAFADLPNSNPSTELAFVQQTVPNATIVPCTFSPSSGATSGTWSSTQNVSYITLKAATTIQLFQVASAPTTSASASKTTGESILRSY